MSNIKFISYTGEYPNLCRGVLTLKIDGKILRFGYGEDYEPFLFSESVVKNLLDMFT